jgi:hypothetical protein
MIGRLDCKHLPLAFFPEEVGFCLHQEPADPDQVVMIALMMETSPEVLTNS